MRDDARTVQMLHIDLRTLVRRDLPRVLEIEGRSFADPWCEEDFVVSIDNPYESAVTAWAGRTIAGYMVTRRENDCIRVLRLAVDPAYRGMRVGMHLLDKAVVDVVRFKRGTLVLTVRERNLPAQLWLRKLGWRAVKIRRGEFGPEDGYRFEMKIEERW